MGRQIGDGHLSKSILTVLVTYIEDVKVRLTPFSLLLAGEFKNIGANSKAQSAISSRDCRDSRAVCDRI